MNQQNLGFDTPLKRSSEDETFDLKRVKKEAVDVTDFKLEINRIPELTPVHGRPSIYLNLKSEKKFSGYDSTPTISTPSDMKQRFEKLIEKGRAAVLKAQEKLESKSSKEGKSDSKPDDPVNLASSEIRNTKKAPESKTFEEREGYKGKRFCLNCKRHGHNRNNCRQRFRYHQSPKGIENNDPMSKEKLKKIGFEKKKAAAINKSYDVIQRSTFHQNQKKQLSNSKASPLFTPLTNALQLDQITEVVNQILYNQLRMMKEQQIQSSCSNCTGQHHSHYNSKEQYPPQYRQEEAPRHYSNNHHKGNYIQNSSRRYYQ